MKFKLDENFGTRTRQVFLDAGHDVQTVRDEGLEGASDAQLYAIGGAEQRCLVTLDLDFADVVRFPPQQASGIIVIRAPRNPSLKTLENLVRQFLQLAEQTPIGRGLWVVEIGRVRVHQSARSEFESDE